MDLEQALQEVIQTVGAYLPRLIGAVALLIIGWVLATIIASLVRRALRKTDLDERLTGWISGEGARAQGGSEVWISRAVFYLLMLFVLVAFFQVLGLTIITEPLNQLLVQLFLYAPRVLGAAILLLIAWIVASLMRAVVTRGLRLARVDDLLRRAGEEDSGRPLLDALGDVVFWLVIVVFLPAVLGALALEGLLTPVQGAIDQVLGFLPNIFAAALILIVGWLVARIVQRIVTALLAGVGTDRFSAQVGLARVLGEQRLSALLGLLVYALILIPVLIAALDALRLVALTGPATNMLAIVLQALPSIFGAALLLILAYVIGRIVAGLATNLLAGLGFDRVPARLGMTRTPEPGGRTPSEIVGYLILVVIMLFATIEGFRLLGFTLVSELVAQFLVFGAQVAVGLVIFALGLFLADVAADAIRGSRIDRSGLLATAARISIVVLASAMALRQMGLAPEIVNLAFGIVLGAIAIAAAIAFGFGGRDIAAEELRDWVRQAKRTDAPAPTRGTPREQGASGSTTRPDPSPRPSRREDLPETGR